MLILISGCDFPDEPPLRIPDQSSAVVADIDSAKSLMPLRPGNKWLYIAAPHQHAQQSPQFAIAVEMTSNGEIFYELRYSYDLKAHVSATVAFPTLLQRSGRGLSLFERASPDDTLLQRPPRLVFTLPYPARLGARWSDPRSDFAVVVAAKDTAIQAQNPSVVYRCYRYDVLHSGRKRFSMYVLPGSALIRVEYEDISFHTIGWWIL